MNNLCTLTDSSSYLNKGLALYDSLVRNHDGGEEFVLHYLCIDREAYNKLAPLKLPHMEVYCAPDIYELTEGYHGYSDHKNDEYTSYQHYCWSLAARFCAWLVKVWRLPSIMYLDSDLLFYYDIKDVYSEIGASQLGITPHMHNSTDDQVGAYNVSVIFFGRGGYKALSWWCKCVCNPGNAWARTHGTCGDQKYLDLFESLFGDVHVITDTIVQGAPWNYRLFDWSPFAMDNRVVAYHGRIVKLGWIHFSHFEPLFNINHYESGEKNYGNFLSIAEPIRHLYNEYLQRLKEAKDAYGL